MGKGFVIERKSLALDSEAIDVKKIYFSIVVNK